MTVSSIELQRAPMRELEAPRDASAWFTVLYRELRRLARGELFRHQALTIGATTLLHEAWLRMESQAPAFASQGQLIGYTARVMRNIVVDHIRARTSLKRGHGYEVIAFDTLSDLHALPAEETLRIDGAIEALAQIDAALAELVELKFFAGLTFGEIAALRGVSERTVQRDWDKARMLLFETLREP